METVHLKLEFLSFLRKAGLPAYTWSDTLAQGASQHDVTMTTTGCGLTHPCPDASLSACD